MFLVNLSKNNYELAGILAHEIGHVKERHAMRNLLQDSTTGLLLILLTGDVGSASSFAAALPTFLLQAKYSRDFEAEADDYAIKFMQKRGISLKHLFNIFTRLQGKQSIKTNTIGSYLSSHPATRERLKKIRGNMHK